MMLNNGSRSSRKEHDSVSRWDGFRRMEGTHDGSREGCIALAILAWFPRVVAETMVLTMAAKAAVSTLPGEIRS